MSHQRKLALAVVYALSVLAAFGYGRWMGYVNVVVMPGTLYNDQAMPEFTLKDENRPNWITGSLALGVSVTDAGTGGRYYPKVGSVGDMAVLRVDLETGAVLAKCVQ